MKHRSRSQCIFDRIAKKFLLIYQCCRCDVNIWNWLCNPALPRLGISCLGFSFKSHITQLHIEQNCPLLWDDLSWLSIYQGHNFKRFKWKVRVTIYIIYHLGFSYLGLIFHLFIFYVALDSKLQLKGQGHYLLVWTYLDLAQKSSLWQNMFTYK